MPDHRDARDAEHAAQLIPGYLERPRAFALAGSGLRVSGRASGVEGDVALDLLHDLMDMAVEDRDRPEATQLCQELIGIAGAPTPGFIDGPQRHVREHHDGSA